MQPVTNQITSEIQCKLCIAESKKNAYELRSMLAVGYTKNSLQVWCTKHKITVADVKSNDLSDLINKVWEGYS